MHKYRVLVVADRMIHRLYFENVIQNSSCYLHVGSESNMKVGEKKCGQTQVDLLLVEVVDRKGYTNFEKVKTLKEKYPYIRIIMITPVPEHTYPRRAKACGADSLWYTENQSEDLLYVMDHTMAGEKIWPERRLPARIGQLRSDQFTEKELLILREVVQGYTNKQISERLNMSYYTVRDYVKAMLEKTTLRSRTELAATVIFSGMIVMEKIGDDIVM